MSPKSSKATSPLSFRYVIQTVIAELQEYQSDPAGKWKSKDTAIYLLTSIASRGSTQQASISVSLRIKLTVSSVSHLPTTSSTLSSSLARMYMPTFKLRLDRFIQSSSSTPSNSCIPSEARQVERYSLEMYTDSQLTKDQLVSVLPMLVQHLQSDNYVIYSYAAITIERILFIKVDRQAL